MPDTHKTPGNSDVDVRQIRFDVSTVGVVASMIVVAATQVWVFTDRVRDSVEEKYESLRAEIQAISGTVATDAELEAVRTQLDRRLAGIEIDLRDILRWRTTPVTP